LNCEASWKEEIRTKDDEGASSVRRVILAPVRSPGAPAYPSRSGSALRHSVPHSVPQNAHFSRILFSPASCFPYLAQLPEFGCSNVNAQQQKEKRECAQG
jgi:hypothetical protein